jgi:phosphoglycerol transferase MdoB-like AlkP superfamily enzyme
MAVLGSPLIHVNTNLNKVASFLESITSNAVSTFAMNANTSLFSPLNGVTNFKVSPTEIYSVILAVLLSGLATSAYKLGYRLGMD